MFYHCTKCVALSGSNHPIKGMPAYEVVEEGQKKKKTVEPTKEIIRNYKEPIEIQ